MRRGSGAGTATKSVPMAPPKRRAGAEDRDDPSRGRRVQGQHAAPTQEHERLNQQDQEHDEHETMIDLEVYIYIAIFGFEELNYSGRFFNLNSGIKDLRNLNSL
jgi:hypothetical protein